MIHLNLRKIALPLVDARSVLKCRLGDGHTISELELVDKKTPGACGFFSCLSWPLTLLKSHNSDTSETAKVGAKHIGHGFGKDLNFCGRSSVLRKVLADIAHRAHDQVACHGTSRL